MSWRARAAIALSAFVVSLLVAQPMLQRIVSSAIARYVSGRVHIDGWTTWSASQNVLTLNRLSIQDDAGSAIRIESLSAKVNPRELLCRNLVLDAVSMDGVVIQPSLDHVPSVNDAVDGPGLRVPTFQDSDWANAIRRQCQDRMQRVTDERLVARAALESQCERLQLRAASLSKLERNPLRNREYLEEARKEWVALRQAVAEERVRLREVDKDLQRDTLHIHETWPDQLAETIQRTMPNRQQAIQHVVLQWVANYLDEYRAILEVVLASAVPTPHRIPASHGTDVAIPGISENYTWIRSASMFGRIESPDRLPVLFKCKLANWSEPITSVKQRPRSEWRFQLPYEGGSRAIEANVERISQDELGTTKISIAMREDAGQPEPNVSRMLWERNPMETVLELSLPMHGPIEGANPVWIACWDESLKEHGRVELQVVVRSAGEVIPTARVIDGPLDCRLHPSSQIQLQRLWDSTQARYADRIKEVASPRVRRVLDEATRTRQQAWMQLTSQQNDLLARIDDEASRIQVTLDALDTDTERLTRKP